MQNGTISVGATLLCSIVLALVSARPCGAAAAAVVSTAGELTPDDLRCESLVEPLGVQEPQPRLSWIVRSLSRGQRQSAYRILVGSNPAVVMGGEGDLWDSGRVASGATNGIVYAGAPLKSYGRCYWRVRVWDRQGKPSDWSRAATWSVGPLEPGDWKAQWIGYDKPREAMLSDAPFEGAKWIGFAGDDPVKAPAGSRMFMTSFTLPKGVAVEKAELLGTGDENVRLLVNGKRIAVVKQAREPKLLDVTSLMKEGDNAFRAMTENEEAGPAGLLAKLTVKLADGKTVTVVTDESWRCTDNPGGPKDYWRTGALAPDAWPPCKVIGDYGCEPWGKLKYHTSPLYLPPTMQLRGTFQADKPVRRAIVYATALGVYDLYLNGRRVNETDFFNPGWTDYTKRVYYRAYDVTDQVRAGANAISAVLADGWYSGYVGFALNRNQYGTRPRFAAQLRVEYADGTTALMATGPDWKAATGPTLEADAQMGETYDARLAADGWDRAGFDDSKWAPVVVGGEVSPAVQWHPGPPVRAIAVFRPEKVTEPKPGVFVLDMGQNFAGVARLKVTGEPGQKIVLRYAEMLNPDGTVYTTNLRNARCVDTYVCRGGGTETWQPRFTFHGFRYVEVTGLKAAPSADAVVGVALSSDTPVVSRFECSDPMLNRLDQNIYWTQRANFIDVPTDCPQRDERLGWTGDAQIYIRTAALNADVQPFFTKWLVDLADGQLPSGMFPKVAPVKGETGDGGPGWADAGVICPWALYEVYGDRRILERHYPGMKRYVEACIARSTPDLLPPPVYASYGDWLSINADTPRDVIYMGYFAQSARLTGEVADVLGRAEDAAKFKGVYEQIKSAFNARYVDDDGKVAGNTQCGYVLALAFDLVDGERKRQAANHLVRDIEARGWHLSTGFIGTKDLMLVLAKIGRNDVAYRLVRNDTFPSWGFSIKHGATSIWERWDGWTPDKGFQDATMNSFAHYSFGAVFQWMVENMGGIRPDAPGYARVTIAPHFDDKTTWVNASYQSVRGPIESRWKRDGRAFTLDVAIPPGVIGTVSLPSAAGTQVTEGDEPVPGVVGVRVLRREGDRLVLAIGSGTYRFGSVITGDAPSTQPQTGATSK